MNQFDRFSTTPMGLLLLLQVIKHKWPFRPILKRKTYREVLLPLKYTCLIISDLMFALDVGRIINFLLFISLVNNTGSPFRNTSIVKVGCVAKECQCPLVPFPQKKPLHT